MTQTCLTLLCIIVTAGPPGLSQRLLCFLSRSSSFKLAPVLTGSCARPQPPSISTQLYPLQCGGLQRGRRGRNYCSGSASGTRNAPGPQEWAISANPPFFRDRGSLTAWVLNVSLSLSCGIEALSWSLPQPPMVPMHAKSLQSSPTLCEPKDCSPPSSSVQGSPGKSTRVGVSAPPGIFPVSMPSAAASRFLTTSATCKPHLRSGLQGCCPFPSGLTDSSQHALSRANK